ncbi:hypothetical protein JMJ35_007895 [Cladonia borealis]|uniref:Uncharacterized protein n=1 Tax=Cladonia borealis TaxID=184061 RepID=A0AA39U7G6_9LECA|nr:hypothetical protein JMJ35_007895 [Cladonia borealis]
MGDILQDFAERKSITVMGRVRYAILDKNKLEDLKGKFSRFTKTFESMLSLLNMEAHDVQIQNDVVSQRKLDAIIHEQSKEAVRRHVEAQETKEFHEKLEQVLEILKQRPFPQASPVTVRDQSQVLDQLETELKNLGVSSEKANAVRHKAVRSVLAQTYLEMLRVFMAIQAPYPGRWLFKRVESASFDIEAVHSSFATAATQAVNDYAVIQKGVYKLVSPYEQPPYKYTEISQVGQRMKSYRSFVFTKSDLTAYQYILSFEPYVNRIKKMREDVQKQNAEVALAQIVKLEGCENISTTVECMQDERNIDKLIESIKAAVKQFVTPPPFNWSRPLPALVNYRMLQFFTNSASLRYVNPGIEEPLQGGPKLKEIEKKTGCSIKVTKYRREDQNCILISIIGHQERNLNEARSLIAIPSLAGGTCFRAA